MDFMDKHFSRYLDLIRFLAAVLVVLTHYVQHGIIGTPAHPLPLFGREAVMVFFVLSGFVIAYSTAEKALTLRQFVVARCARIYSGVLPVLLMCFLLVVLAAQWTAIPANIGYQPLKPYLYLPLHLLFMGELWNLSEVPPWLIQYWSLGYEVWYYVLFGVAYYLRGARRLLLGALVLAVMGPKLWLLLPVWLAGACLYRYQRNLPLSRTMARVGWLATLVVLGAYKYFGVDLYLRALGIALWPFPALHLGSADRYLADYAVCILVYLNFLLARQADFSALAHWDTPIRALAAYTFTLYLVHGPVMGLWGLFYRHDPASLVDIAALSLAIGLATYVVGLLTERRKAWFQRGFDQLSLSFARRAV
jgi:peptidoglycan/LPS O-acetylase OafA/YrhL